MRQERGERGERGGASWGARGRGEGWRGELFSHGNRTVFKGNRNNKTFLQRLRCILWVITLNFIISYYQMRFYTQKTELEASTCQFAKKIRN